VRNKVCISFPLLLTPSFSNICLQPPIVLTDPSAIQPIHLAIHSELLNALSRPLISSVTASCYPVHSARLPRWIGPPQVYCTTKHSYDSSISHRLRAFRIRNTNLSGRRDYFLCFSQRHGDSYINRVFRLSHGVRPGSQTNGPSGVVAPGSRTGVFRRNIKVVLKVSGPFRISFACLVALELLSSGSLLLFRSPSLVGRG